MDTNGSYWRKLSKAPDFFCSTHRKFERRKAEQMRGKLLSVGLILSINLILGVEWPSAKELGKKSDWYERYD